MTADGAAGRRRAAMDASSAILLLKAGLLEPTLHIWRVIISPSVLDEITRPGYPGSAEFSSLTARGQVEILDPGRGEDDDVRGAGMGAGETGTILLVLSGAAEFALLDDGRAAAFCRRRAVPYINALLVPRILHLRGAIGPAESRAKFDELSSLGRYAGWVVDYARGCGMRELEPFL